MSRGDHAYCRGLCPRDGAISARCYNGFFDLVLNLKFFDCFTKVVAGFQGANVAIDDFVFALKFLFEHANGRLDRAVKNPV